MSNIARYKTLVVGLGKTGLSCARYFSRRNMSVAVIDSRTHPPALEDLRRELPNVAVFLGGFDPAVFAAADQLIVSPGVALSEPLLQEAAQRNAEIIGDVELFAKEAKAPVIAITGSNGKSTVTTLVGAMARHHGIRAAVGGNLGVPVLDLLDDQVELYVLELSSFQMETTESLYSVAAVVLNVTPDHLDRYQGVEHYAASKAKLYAGAEIGVINRDDPMVCAMSGQATTEVGFTLSKPAKGDFGLCQEADGIWLCKGEQRLLNNRELKIAGRHNLANALAALALGEAIGLPMVTMLEVLRHYSGLPHRTQYLGQRAGVRWYNDSKGTNPGASISALQGLHQDDQSRTVLIAGGVAKGADFSDLKPVVVETARAVILIGEAAGQIEQNLADSVPLYRAESLDDAVTQAAALAQPGDRVLLSPACASFDMFASYEARGDAFIKAFQRLPS